MSVKHHKHNSFKVKWNIDRTSFIPRSMHDFPKYERKNMNRDLYISFMLFIEIDEFNLK